MVSKRGELFETLYEEFRGLARQFFRDQPTPHTLEATALVNEVFVRVMASSSSVNDECHMANLCALAMRRVLIDHARARKTRGQRERDRATGTSGLAESDEELLSLDALILKYEKLDPRKCELVRLHVFGGFNLTQCADLLGVSRRTATADWQIARAWLASQLQRRDH